MTKQEFSKLVDVKYQRYIDWGYDLFAIKTEEGMINGTPSHLFDGGEEGKEAALCALHHLWCKLMDERVQTNG